MNSELQARPVQQIVGREGNQRACHRQLVRNVVDRRRVNSTVGRASGWATLLEHAEQESPPIHSLNIPDQLVSSPGRLPAPHSLRFNPFLRHDRSFLYARTRICHFDPTEAALP